MYALEGRSLLCVCVHRIVSLKYAYMRNEEVRSENVRYISLFPCSLYTVTVRN